MKKKFVAAVLVIALIFSLSITASAANSPAGNNSTPTSSGAGASADKGTQLNARARIMTCLSTMTQNRSIILTCKAENTQLASQLRTMLQEIKANGTALTEDMLESLKALKTQLQAKRGELAATTGDIEALMLTYREYKQAGDFENAAAILDQVIAIQQTRITLQNQIKALTQQMLDLLGTV